MCFFKKNKEDTGKREIEKKYTILEKALFVRKEKTMLLVLLTIYR